EHGQLAREEGYLAAGGDRLPELSADEGEVLVETLDAAELGDQLHRRLLAHAADPRDVVDGVAHQREHVGDLGRLDPPALAYLRLVVDHFPPGATKDGQHAHARPAHLEQVLVTGDDHHVGPRWQGPSHKRGQHVVGLVARYLHDRDSHRLEEPTHVGEL